MSLEAGRFLKTNLRPASSSDMSKNKERFYAGVSLGRASIFAIFGGAKGGDHARAASTYLQQAHHEEAAHRAQVAAGSPTSVNVQAAIEASQDAVPYPPQHWLNAGIQLGWAIETCAGKETADVKRVVKNLEDCRDHMNAIANASQVEPKINPVLDPISNLINAEHPKPQELPQHKDLVEKLRTSLGALVR